MTSPQYNPNVPRAGDSIATSQPDFLANFMTLFNAFSTNHVDLEDALAGNHTIVELTAQTANFLSNAGEISEYSRIVEEQGTQVFLKYQGTASEFQFSCYQIYSIPPISIPPPFIIPGQPQVNGTQSIYFTFLPGRVLLYFGVFSPAIASNNQFLTLIPPVATDIITADFCVAGTTPSFKPVISVQVQDNGIISKINVKPPSVTNPVRSNSQYVVLAKI